MGEENLVGLLDFRPFLNREAAAPQSDDVEPGKEVDLMYDAIGRDVASHAGVALHHRVIADVNELVDGRASTDEDAVAEFTMARNHDVIGNHVIAADLHVVTEVGDSHEEVPVSDDRVAVFLRASVNGHVLSKGISLADQHAGHFGRIETKVLRISSDHGSVANKVPCPHGDAATDFRMGIDFTAPTEGDFIFNNREGADLDIFGE